MDCYVVVISIRYNNFLYSSIIMLITIIHGCFLDKFFYLHRHYYISSHYSVFVFFFITNTRNHMRISKSSIYAARMWSFWIIQYISLSFFFHIFQTNDNASLNFSEVRYRNLKLEAVNNWKHFKIKQNIKTNVLPQSNRI